MPLKHRRSGNYKKVFDMISEVLNQNRKKSSRAGITKLE
jgi:hypothetical protein